MEADHTNSVPLVNARILLLQLLLNGCHFGAGLGDRHAVLEPRENYEFVIFAIELAAIEREWLPHFELWKSAIQGKTLRQDSNHSVWFFIQQNRLAENFC